MNPTILTVDDTEATRSLLKVSLELEGYKVISASNGAVALRYLDSFKPNLIITDLVMRDVNGLSLIKHIRLRPELMAIPIIAISAFFTYHNEAKKNGATMVLNKPFDVIELPKIVGQLLSSSESLV
jgi:CheY-like chemotaxis protein